MVVLDVVQLTKQIQNINMRILIFCFIGYVFIYAKLCIFRKKSKKYFAVVNGEYATISDFADLPRREQFYIAIAGIKIVAERDAIMQAKYFAVGFPNGNIHRVAAVKHSASRGNVYRF